MPVRSAKISIVRWWIEPAPAEPKDIIPGFDFASAMNSGSVVAGTDGTMTRAVGTVASAVIGVKSAKV